MVGQPSTGHRTDAASSASWTASSHAVEVPVVADERAEDLRRQVAQQVLDAGVGAQRSVRGLVHQRPDLDLADAGERHAGRDLERAFEALTVDDVEAAQVLLGFEVRPVGDHRRTVDERHGLGVHLVGDAPRADELARLAQFLLECVRVLMTLANSSWGKEFQSSSLP